MGLGQRMVLFVVIAELLSKRCSNVDIIINFVRSKRVLADNRPSL